jgi:hypothetical protein
MESDRVTRGLSSNPKGRVSLAPKDGWLVAPLWITSPGNGDATGLMMKSPGGGPAPKLAPDAML